MSSDAIYTPTALALQLLSFVKKDTSPRTIVDFAAGDGELLRVAAHRWPKGRVFANDIDAATVARLKRSYPLWKVSKVDFLNSLSPKWGSQKFDLILLNPPFTCRGGTKFAVQIGDESVTTSKAGAFVATALRFMRTGGQLLAIVPSGTLDNEKDKLLWNKITVSYNVSVLGENHPLSFQGIRIRTHTIRIFCRSLQARRHFWNPCLRDNHTLPTVSRWLVRRGSCQMNTTSRRKSGVPVLHTTNLADNSLSLENVSYRGKHWTISGPLVLLPRVCNPNTKKVGTYLDDVPIVLSDCLFGVRCKSKAEAVKLAKYVSKDWKAFSRFYKGTCAQFLTCSALQSYLSGVRL